MGQVIRISEHRGNDVVVTLDGLLTEARMGRMTGMVFVAKFGQWQHQAHLVGDYKEDVAGALAAGIRLVRFTNRYADVTAAAQPGWDQCEGCKYKL